MGQYQNRVDLLPQVLDRIVAGCNPQRVLLFGSRARGDARSDSDIDLLLVFDDVKNRADAAGRALDTFADLPVFVDILVATAEELKTAPTASASVARAALAEGTLLYERRAVA